MCFAMEGAQEEELVPCRIVQPGDFARQQREERAKLRADGTGKQALYYSLYIRFHISLQQF